ncbi:ABC transporter permease [Novosphingobium sp. BL-52-GroH]|uniref:ABC transporter permease n=1 Tax=Novosphingobium sp. BL-52-GroH TaxID=3349877 RepID=UPI003850896A
MTPPLPQAALQQGALAVRLRHGRTAARFVGSTLGIAVPVFLVATLITFLLGVVSGLDPAAGIAGDAASPETVARIRADLGLDQPVVVQYLQWMGQVLRGNLGTSWFNGVPATELIVQRLPISLSIAGMALLVGLVLGTGLGLVAGVRNRGRLDRAITLFAAIVSSLPPFVVAFVLILVFSLWLGWLPSSGYVPFSEDPAGWLAAIGIPAVALSVDVVADLARQLRTGLVSALSENYVTGAVVRGLSRRRILFVHVLRNAAGPALTVVALRVPMLIGGAVVTEAIFNMPGMGKLAADSALRGDVPVVQGTLVVSIVLILACNMFVNVLLGVLQPAARRRS